MSLPTVKYNVYSSLRLHGSDSDVIPYEAMFNLVQSTFVILQSTPTFEGNSQETLSNGQRNFHILFLRFFEPEESMKVYIIILLEHVRGLYSRTSPQSELGGWTCSIVPETIIFKKRSR